MLVTKKILVGLDGSEMDQTLITFINYILKSSPAEHVYFLNVVSKIEHLADDGIQAKKIDDIAINNNKVVLQHLIDQGITTKSNAQIHLEVVKGAPAKIFLRFVEKNDIDIIITARKKDDIGGGTLNNRLARRAPCNLIIVPEGYKPGLQKLLVPVDVSHFNVDSQADYSKKAIEYAIYVSRSNDNRIEVICQNVYSVPSGFRSTGKTFEQFSEIMRNNCKNSFEQWLESIDYEGVPITPVYSLMKDKSYGQIIKETALEHRADGIVIGAKGRSSVSSIFMSSSAEDLIKNIDYLPLTIVRPKGITVGIFSSLREI